MTAVFIIACMPGLLLISYPVYTWLRFTLFKLPVKKSHWFEQPVNILISCYNEEKHVKQRSDTFLHEDEWIEGSEIIVVWDGSTDGTNAILRQFDIEGRIKAVILSRHCSKIKSLNQIVPLAKNENLKHLLNLFI
ncbi:MAG TPA: glycosyltransferase [Flavobacteriales bacterium]|nr:glycosyltransferase [Flavobacteriales bacterium]